MKKELNEWFKKIGMLRSYSYMLQNNITEIEFRHLRDFKEIPECFFKTHFKEVKFFECEFPEIKFQEWNSVTHLDLSNCKINEISNIEILSNITILELQGNYLTKGSFSNKVLKELYLNSNNIQALDINCPKLRVLECENNLNLKSFKIQKNKLTSLMLDNGKIDNIDLYHCLNLKHLWLNGNNLKKLKCPSKNLIELCASNCNLESVDVSLNSLSILKIMNNPLRELHFDQIKKIKLSLNCDKLKVIEGSDLHKLLMVNEVKNFQVFENTSISDFL